MCTDTYDWIVYRLFEGKGGKMKNDLYAHTIDIRSWISVKEAQELCQRLNVPFSKETVIKSVKIDGINQIKLKHNKAYIENKMIDRYGIEVQVNVGKLLKKSKVAMTVINNKTVTQMIKILNMVFAKEFGLNSKHSDAGSWNISRIDCGIDLKLCTDNPTILREYIRLLHDSFDVQNSKNITYSNYKTCKNWDDIRHESITLTSQGEATNEQRYKYNIYYKRQQLLAYAKENGIILSQEEIQEVSNVIRIEKQIFQVGKVFRRSSKLSSLLDEDLTENVMDNIVKEMRLMFGKGDYLSDTDALSRIYQSKHSEKVQNELGVMYENIKCIGYKNYIETQIGLLTIQGASQIQIDEAVKAIKENRKKLEDMGISVASTDIVQAQTNINELLEQHLLRTRKPRKKGKFGAIIEITEPGGKKRFKCNVSLHNFDGHMRKRISIASPSGGTKEECEQKILNKIEEVIKDNLRIVGNDERAITDCYEYALEDLRRFRTVVESPNVAATVDNAILMANGKLLALKPDEYTAYM